ncbi:universal stress protein [Rugosimonospora africana]|uniref:UspA domain-containing protein n=1 Tax=Rugosimonospora africana TaxID=556532 RepID=A0A8J3VVV8_9ACTN|nr:universal stress protein [Rugosimonospora africana]GIH21087.1 hypothetical protein Raf01_92590 [Rugosimonospora africana]
MSGERERRVIVGVQDSVAGLQALRRGVEEARRRRATLYLVRVAPGSVDRYAGPGVWAAELAVWAGEYAQQTLAKSLGAIPGDVEMRTVALQGAVAPALLRFADRDDDLLVVGDAQSPGVRRLWSGRVARQCVRRATCPVLVVPPPALSRVTGRVLTRELQRMVDTG